MMKFLKELKRRVNLLLRGRYGHDDLNNLILILYLMSIFFAWILPFKLVDNILLGSALVLMLCLLFRTFSKNIYQRNKENQLYLKYKNKLFSRPTPSNYKIFRCPACNQKVRVPKGKGRIEITCPKCHTRFEKKS